MTYTENQMKDWPANMLDLHDAGVGFDWAVPQPWLDDIAERCGEYFLGWVWSYPEGSIFGLPSPRTDKAERILIELGEPYYKA